MIDQLNFIYKAGAVTRFHTMSTLRKQTIADHSWHMAMIAHILYGQTEPGITPTFLMAIMTHDMAECEVGDLPAPGKRAMDARYTLVDEKPLDEAGAHSFRDAWGIMEQEILQPYAMNWEGFLTEEEKRRLKLCDAFEGLFYCIGERGLGNQFIGVAYNNFSKYVGELLHDGSFPTGSTEDNEWVLFEHSRDLWRKADGNS